MRVLNKVKTFAWRAWCEILRTCSKLFDCGIIPSYTCPGCKEDPETPHYALFSCNLPEKVWSVSSLQMDASWLSEISVADVVQQIMSSWGQDFSTILAQMMSRLLIYCSKPKEQMNFDPINMNKSPSLVQ